MRNKTDDFYPDWDESPPPEGSYRSILKWGNPTEFKHPNRRLFGLMKKTFDMTDDDFKIKKEMGLEKVCFDHPIELGKEHIDAFIELIGRNNVKTDDYSRLQVAYGKTMIDLMRLRKGIVENIPDLVLHPNSKVDIQNIVAYCHEHFIPVTI